MKWENVQKQKLTLTREVVESLDEVERELLKEILKFERKDRGSLRSLFRKFYRDQLDSRIPKDEESSE